MAGTDWGQVGGMLAGQALSGLGNYFGSKSQADALTDAARIQAEATAKAQREAQAFQEKQLGIATNMMSPYTDMGTSALGDFQNFNTTGVGGDILGQMNDLANAGVNIDYQSDPAYQWRLAQAEEQAQRQMASLGGLDSRLAYDVTGDRAMALSGEEADKQYLRGVDEYNRKYGNLGNQYNYQYGGLTDQLNLGYGATQALAGMTTGVGSNVGNQLMSSGLSSANNTARLMSQAGQAEGQGYAGLGTSLGDMLSTYSLRDPISSIMEGLTNDKPNTTYGGGGWGANNYSLMGNQKQQNPYSLMGNTNQYSFMQPASY